ncbi:MAG: response regulator, partial [Bryobacteraceae bacterium]|nr:response regulator [Bryobacteraceae bacterium]
MAGEASSADQCLLVHVGNAADGLQALRPSVMVVDNDPGITHLLAELLSDMCRYVKTAADGPAALKLLRDQSFDLVITDLLMPGMSGLDLLDTIRKTWPDTGVVLLSGCNDVPLAVKALQSGALDYVVKPPDLDAFQLAIHRALLRQQAAMAHRLRLTSLEDLLAEQSQQLTALGNSLAEASERAMEALVTALDVRERETQNHSRRVSNIALALAQAIGLDRELCRIVRQGALLHDIGKIGIPDSILLRAGPLSPPEWEVMRRHPEIGHRILAGVDGLREAAVLVLAHHERWDGSGYPHGLLGANIPQEARIFAIADCFDAMTSDRP